MGECPVCNGFYRLDLKCSCGSVLEDTGRLENFADPYSPYQDYEEDIFFAKDPLKGSRSECVHLMSCKKCKKDERVVIAKQ